MKNYRIIFKDNEDSYTYTGKYIGIESFANTKYIKLNVDGHEVEIDTDDIIKMEEI